MLARRDRVLGPWARQVTYLGVVTRSRERPKFPSESTCKSFKSCLTLCIIWPRSSLRAPLSQKQGRSLFVCDSSHAQIPKYLLACLAEGTMSPWAPINFQKNHLLELVCSQCICSWCLFQPLFLWFCVAERNNEPVGAWKNIFFPTEVGDTYKYPPDRLHHHSNGNYMMTVEASSIGDESGCFCEKKFTYKLSFNGHWLIGQGKTQLHSHSKKISFMLPVLQHHNLKAIPIIPATDWFPPNCATGDSAFILGANYTKKYSNSFKRSPDYCF